jgi:hypothetical protein
MRTFLIAPFLFFFLAPLRSGAQVETPAGLHLPVLLNYNPRVVMMKVNTPLGKIEYPFYPDANSLAARLIFIPANLPFYVVFRNDSVQSVRGYIEYNDSLFTIVLRHKEKDGWKIVRPGQTRQLFYVQGKDTVRGHSFGECWLFRSLDGRISGYSAYLPRREPQFLRLNDKGKLYPFDQESVIALVQDNKKALSLAEKGRLLAAIIKYNEW